MKKFLLSLLSLVGFVSYIQAEEVTFDFVTDDYNFTRDEMNFVPSGSVIREGDVSIKFTSNGSGMYFKTAGLNFVWNGYGAFDVSVPDGMGIDKVTLNHETYGTFSLPEGTSGTFEQINVINAAWTKDESASPVGNLTFSYVPKGNGYSGCLKTVTVTYSEAKQTAPTVVDSKDFDGWLTVNIDDEGDNEAVDATITLNEYSDGTYGMYLADFGGLGAIDISGLTLNGTELSGHVDGLEIAGGMIKANADVTGTYDETDLVLHLDIEAYEPAELPVKVDFTTKAPEEPGLKFRRLYTDGSSRYYNNISYTVLDKTKEAYSTANPTTESYYVAPKQNQWQEEGAYIDLTDKVIEIPVNAKTFTVILKSDASNCSSKWSQNAVFVDWNGNGAFTDEGETNGVINIDKKANEAGGGLVVTATGDTDVITLPEGLNVGDTFNVLIAMTEPKGTEGNQDLWNTGWEWTKEIFANGVCSLINGQAYGLTLRITDADLSAIDNIVTDASADAPVEYFTIQGVRVAADCLTPGIYIARQGNKTYKIFVK